MNEPKKEGTWATNHLFGYHDDCLDGEPAVAVIEEILERGSKQVDNENVVQPFLAEVVYIRDASFGDRLAILGAMHSSVRESI